MKGSYSINLEVLPHEVFRGLEKLDKGYIGSPNYMGLAFYWAWEYRHFLREASLSQRRRVHKQALDLGLDMLKVGVEQWQLIGRVLRKPNSAAREIREMEESNAFREEILLT
tara:strand:- start:553 stop:888 length:336 start_codon:yes stop_codon:yes gene_type:complete